MTTSLPRRRVPGSTTGRPIMALLDLLGRRMALRILWGFVGSRHARFVDFIQSPRAALAYLGNLLRRRAPRHLGHSPAGGAMIVLLILGLAGISVTGLALYAVEENAGPLAGWIGADAQARQTGAPGATAVASVEARDEDGHGRGRHDAADEDFWEDLHKAFVNFTLLLVALHIAGVAWASAVHRENLVRSMFTGRKRAE